MKRSYVVFVKMLNNAIMRRKMSFDFKLLSKTVRQACMHNG